jgi:hypothetical protein
MNVSLVISLTPAFRVFFAQKRERVAGRPRPVAERYATSPVVAERSIAAAGFPRKSETEEHHPMKGILIRAATVLLGISAYVGLGIALASAG